MPKSFMRLTLGVEHLSLYVQYLDLYLQNLDLYVQNLGLYVKYLGLYIQNLGIYAKYLGLYNNGLNSTANIVLKVTKNALPLLDYNKPLSLAEPTQGLDLLHWYRGLWLDL